MKHCIQRRVSLVAAATAPRAFDICAYFERRYEADRKSILIQQQS